MSMERAMKVIGEAARRVSPEFQADHGEMPWALIIGQRNILAPGKEGLHLFTSLGR